MCNAAVILIPRAVARTNSGHVESKQLYVWDIFNMKRDERKEKQSCGTEMLCRECLCILLLHLSSWTEALLQISPKFF